MNAIEVIRFAQRIDSAARPEPPLTGWAVSVGSVRVTRRSAENYAERQRLHTVNSHPRPNSDVHQFRLPMPGNREGTYKERGVIHRET